MRQPCIGFVFAGREKELWKWKKAGCSCELCGFRVEDMYGE